MRVKAVRWGGTEVVATWNGQAPVPGQMIHVQDCRGEDAYYEVGNVAIEISYVGCDDPEVTAYVEPKLSYGSAPWRPI